MKLYNTRSKKIEDFIPWDEKRVTFYTCGPTVYHYAHIGNIRNYIGHDILDRTLRYLGYNVFRVMNITDVGHLSSDSDTGVDKMVSSAKKEKKTVKDIADFYTDAFFKDYYLVNNRKCDLISKATDNIDEYIKIMEKLISTGYAYFKNGNVYFDTSKLENYYCLTNQDENDLQVASREDVTIDNNKKNQNDFVLWFTKSKFQEQELKWDSPWGYGYPGWHIECTGISLKYIGEYLDIHGGGVDNIFPHHTNEIAQSEAYLGHTWCKYWFHNEHLCENGGKMSKSKGDILTVTELKNKGYNPLSFRYMCLESHYRRQLSFSFDALDIAQNSYNKLKEKCLSIKEDGEFNESDFNKWNNIFIDAISDDLNTANALTCLYELLKSDVSNITKIKLIDSFDKVLALDLLKKDEVVIDDEIQELIDKRNEARKNKDFKTADLIRDELLKKGYIIKDTKDGLVVSKVNERNLL